jgi:hypothetical protein
VKNIFIFTLLLAIVLQSFSKLAIWIEFKINQEYIAKNLCVQKEVEDNCCQGSCHLKEKMEEDDKNQDTQNSNFKPLKEIQLFHENPICLQLHCPLTLENIYVSYQKNHLPTFTEGIFHPPNFLS